MGTGSSGASKGGGRASKKGGGSFHQFADKAAGTHEYEGDGTDVVEYFKKISNFNTLLDGMTAGQHDAFRSWMSGYFMSGQQYRGWDRMTKHEQDMTRAFDQILDQATLSEGITVTRRSDTQLVLGAGKKRATLEELRAAEGSIVLSKGSMSTGAASQGLTIGDESKPIEYKINIPAGKGAGMWIGDRRVGGWGAKQREFMTNRDSLFQVGKTTLDKARGIFITELTYVGRQEHDYGSEKTTGRSRRRR